MPIRYLTGLQPGIKPRLFDELRGALNAPGDHPLIVLVPEQYTLQSEMELIDALGIPGSFSVSNALTAMAAGAILDIPLDDMAASLGRARGVKGRVEVVPTPADYTVIIDYAHTPDALEKVLKTMKAVASGRVVAVFGCGGDRDRTKRPIMGRVAAENADFTVVTSDNPRTEEPEAIIAEILEGMPPDAPRQVIPDRRLAIAWAMDHHEPGDVIVLAGKGHETYQEINGVKNHMDEREIVAAHRKEIEG